MLTVPSASGILSRSLQKERIDDARLIAQKLHEAYAAKKSFPLLWSCISYDVNKLMDIFEFFAGIEFIMINTRSSFIAMLHNRLRARYYGTPLPIPFEYKVDLEDLNKLQLSCFDKLIKKNLLKPAFELFVTGSMNPVHKHIYSGKIEEDSNFDQELPVSIGNVVHYPEPDSALFFYWAEFAFLATAIGNGVSTWKAILPVLLRGERLYALCYGKPVKGQIPSHTTFNMYDLSGFGALSPDLVKDVDYPPNGRFDALENEAVKCALFAFPKEIESIARLRQ